MQPADASPRLVACTQQEEPFQILPLEVLCEAIRAQSTELLASDAAVAALVAGYGATPATPAAKAS